MGRTMLMVFENVNYLIKDFVIESEDAAASSVSFNILNWVISQQYISINPGDNIDKTVS